jgi:hypothetical protein
MLRSRGVLRDVWERLLETTALKRVLRDLPTIDPHARARQIRRGRRCAGRVESVIALPAGQMFQK